MMRHAWLCLFGLICSAVLTPSAWAQREAPAAIVVDVSDTAAGVAALDFLRRGERVIVPPGTTLTLGYLVSCIQETIRGGIVLVGDGTSEISGGVVTRETLRCPQPANLDPVTVASTGVLPRSTYRGGSKGQPALIIFYTAPVIALRSPGEVLLERVDREETPRSFAVDGPFLDLAKQQIFLSAGGTYRLSAGGRELLFQVSFDAFQGGGPLLARLLRI